MSTIDQNREALRAAGWNAGMATALAENDHTPESAALLSEHEALDLFLTWEGIIGFTGHIIAAVDSVRTMVNKGRS